MMGYSSSWSKVLLVLAVLLLAREAAGTNSATPMAINECGARIPDGTWGILGGSRNENGVEVFGRLSLRGGSRKNSISKRLKEHKRAVREYRRDQNAAIAKSQRKVEKRRLKAIEGLESAVGSLSLSLEGSSFGSGAMSPRDARIGQSGGQQMASRPNLKKRKNRILRGKLSARQKKDLRRRKKMEARFAKHGMGPEDVVSLLGPGPVG